MLEERRKRRFELQRCLFELRTETTLHVIKAHKLGTSTVRSACMQIEEAVAGALKGVETYGFEQTFTNEMQSAIDTLKKLSDAEPGSEALLAFFYGEDVINIARQQEEAGREVKRKLVTLFQQLTTMKQETPTKAPADPDRAKA